METITNPNKLALHRIRVQLHPNNLPKIKGRYIAKPKNGILTVEQICATLVTRGGFVGSYDALVSYVKQFLDEAMYQLCDGFGVDFGYCSITVNIGGTINSTLKRHNRRQNPIQFKFHALRPMKDLIKHIKVDIVGLADAKTYITDFVDITEQSKNTLFVPGNMFIITGNKIKIKGDDPACGVYFVPEDDPSKAVKVEHLAGNSSRKIIGKAPDTGYTRNRIEIRTQFTGSAKIILKSPRIITSEFVLEKKEEGECDRLRRTTKATAYNTVARL